MMVSKTRADGDLSAAPDADTIDLQPGDWVERRPIEEIAPILDEEQKHGGLIFVPGMKQFRGQRTKVLKRVKTVELESTGEVRRLKVPPVSLEGVDCDGEFYEGCDRACLHDWRDARPGRVPRRSEAPPAPDPGAVHANPPSVISSDTCSGRACAAPTGVRCG